MAATALILTICHQENSQAPSPDTDLFPEKCPGWFELPRACFDHSAVGLQADQKVGGTRHVVSTSMRSLMMRQSESLKMRSWESLE